MRRLAGRILALAVALGASPAFAQAPHHDYTTVQKTATALSAQTDATLWTPATGKAFILYGCVISARLPVRVELEVSDVDVVPPIYFESNGTVLVGGHGFPIYMSATNAVLTWTTSVEGMSDTHDRVSVLCWGYESQR